MNQKTEKRLAIGLYGISVIMLGLMVFLSCNTSIWKDEVYTLEIIQHPYAYFLLTNRDAAPPLHFAILKFFVDLLQMVMPGVSYLILAKMVSVLPFVLLVIFSFVKIRKQHGLLVSALFAFLITTMPKMLAISIEVRQYAWAMFFTTVCFIYFWDMLTSNNFKAGAICLLFGVLATGTHYFACFAVAFMYLFIFINAIKKGNKKQVRIILGIIIGSCVLFAPWLIIAGKQVIATAQGFWIPNITARNIPGFLSYIFMTETNKFNLGYVVVAIFYILCAYLLLGIIKEKTDGTKKKYICIGMGAPYVVLVIGVIIGMYIWPVFQVRYIFPAIGCLWLGFAIALENRKKDKKLFAVILLVLLAVCGLNVLKIAKDELQYSKNIDDLLVFFDDLDENDIIISDDYRTPYCFTIYIDNMGMIWNEETAGVEQIRQWQTEGRNIYYFDTNQVDNSDNDFLHYADANELSLVNCGEYGLEYVFSEVYMVK